MNEFTKNELERIANGIEREIVLYSIMEIDASHLLNLLEKVESIINNYCDHEPCSIDHDHKDLSCKKCLKIVE